MSKEIINHLEKFLEERAGKVFGLNIIVTENIKNKEYIAGFEAGKEMIIDQMKSELKTLKKYFI